MVADESRRRLVGAVAAEKGQIDQGRDPQPHMVEPDEDSEPVIGEQAGEHGEAELPEVRRTLGRVRADGDARADRAVLIVPGRVRRLAQERVDDRRHPQAPAQHAHPLLHQAFDAGRTEQRLDRTQASLQRRVEQNVVDREQRRGERPVDDARHRLGPEQPDAARDLAEIDRAVFVEDRVGGEVAELAAVEPVVDVGIGPELVDHDMQLRRVEIPAERAGDQAAKQNAQRVKPPALQLFPLACGSRSTRRRRGRRRHNRARRSQPSRESARRRRRPRDWRDRRAQGQARRQARARVLVDRDKRPSAGRRRAAFRRRCRRSFGRAERGARR